MCTHSFLLCVGLKSRVRTVVPVAGVVLVVQVKFLKSQSIISRRKLSSALTVENLNLQAVPGVPESKCACRLTG